MEICLRDYQRSDFDVLFAIDQRCFPAGIAYSRAELSAYLRRAGAFSILATDVTSSPPSIPGFIVAESSRRGIGHIITLDVLPEARRAGVGSQLMSAAEQRLKAANCHAVVLETAVDNLTALSFYKRHNYFCIKTVPRYYSNGVDAFVLQKDLLSPAQAS